MKLYTIFEKHKWWINLIFFRADLNKVKDGYIDVLGGFGMGRGLAINSFSLKKQLFFHLYHPQFHVKETEYKIRIGFSI